MARHDIFPATERGARDIPQVTATHKAIATYYADLAQYRTQDVKYELAALLNTFFDYTEAEIADFEKAVDAFKEEVPRRAAIGVAAGVEAGA